MSRPSPSQIVAGLDPRERDILKREEHTMVWREHRPDGECAVVKLYRRRGWLSVFRSTPFRYRTEREFRRLLHLHRWGVPCTLPLAWAHGHSPTHGYHEILVMREVPNAITLTHYLHRQEGAPDLTPLFRVVRRMHESGFCNQTLYAANILVRVGAPPAEAYHLSDVPRSWTFPRSIVGTRMALRDLLCLVLDLEQAGIEPGSIPLDAYGLSDADRRFLDHEHDRDPRTKRRRLERDLRARTRWVLAWSAVWKRRNRPPTREPVTRPGSLGFESSTRGA